MSKIFNIDYNTLIRWLVPVPLRQPKMIAWLQALVWPVVQLYQAFRKNRDGNLYRLSITPQVCFLEKMLNDRFDNADRRIFIDDAIDRPPVYLYQDAEEKPVYLGTRPLYQDTEFGINLDDFTVWVHSSIVFEFNEMRSLINLYKLAATRYSIQFYS
jgi:hypothetical protein